MLEIGGGTGANLGYYSAGVESLTVTEPEPPMLKRLERKAREQNSQANLHARPLHRLPADGVTQRPLEGNGGTSIAAKKRQPSLAGCRSSNRRRHGVTRTRAGKGSYCISFGALMVRLALEVVDERAAVGKPLDIALNEIGTRCTASERLHATAVEPRHS